MENNRVEGNKRISVFSFGRDWVVPDFIFFIAVVVIYGIIVTQYEFTQVRANSIETVITIVGDISSFIPVAIVLTFIFERMSDFNYDSVEGEAVGRAEGQAIGRTETYQLWSSWNIRRMEAERQNLPFDEPPPPLPEVTAE